MKKKILHIIIQSSYDGAVVVPLNIIKNTPEFTHSIISVYKGSASEEINKMKIDLDHLVDRPMNIGAKRLRANAALIKYLIKNEFDIIHYHQGGFSFLATAFFLKKKAKLVHHFHSADLYGRGESYETPIIHRLILKALKNKTIQIAISEFIKNHYERIIDKRNNLFLIKNGAEGNFNIEKSHSNKIGYLGRVHKIKGSEILDSLIRRIPEFDPKINLLIKGEFYDEIIESENVEVIPASFNNQNFFDQIDLLIFPSLAAEGLALVVLEAFANNVPVIAFKKPALEK